LFKLDGENTCSKLNLAWCGVLTAVLLRIVTLCLWVCSSGLFDLVALRMKAAKSFQTSRTTRPATRRHIAQVFSLLTEF